MKKTATAVLIMMCLAGASCAESPYIFGWHFWRDSANIDCGGGRPGWVVGLEVSSNFQPDVDKFRWIADEGHTIIMRVDYDGSNTFPPSSSDYWLHAARYAFWVYKLKDYCHIWLIGNEESMNTECFRQVRRAVHAIQPHAIFCAGAPHNPTSMLQTLGDYVDGQAQHTYGTDWITDMDTAIPSGKTKLAYITEFQSAPPNPGNDFANSYAAFNNYNLTHTHKLEAACKFVYYEFGSEYTALQMQPMQDGDFNNTATLNAYTNSYAQPYILISDVAAAGVNENTSQITWTTDTGSTGQIEYWEDREIGQHWSPFYDGTLTSHTATIGPLIPGHTYHYIIKCYRSGRPLTLSEVYTFVHEPPTSGTITGHVKLRDGTPVHGATVTRSPGGYSFTTGEDGSYTIRGCPAGVYSLTVSSTGTNTVTRSSIEVAAGQTTTMPDILLTPRVNYLSNPGFESSMSGWTGFGSAPNVYVGPWFGGIEAHSGSHFLGMATNWGTPTGGVYQKVTGLPAGTYTFTAFARLYHGDNPYSETKERIGVDPFGGTDPASANVQWSAWDYNFWHWESWWKQLTTPAVSVGGGSATVFVHYDDPTPQGWHIHAYDDLALVSGVLQTQTAANPAAAKAFEDGAPVQLSGMIATTDRNALGADVVYIEDSQRTSGIRVDAAGIATAVSEGSTVNVIGMMATANGERYIDATALTAAAGTAVTPLEIVNRAAGGGDYLYEPGPPVIGQRGVAGGVGANNVGMLVRTTGRIASTGSGFVMISDGSPAELKVDVSHVANPPSSGQVAVTGILSVEVSGADLIPVLRPRKSADIQVVQP
mgnify:CR=1 FL=1